MQLAFPDTDLAAEVPVGEPDDHAVLGCVVLVLVLHDQALAGKEVSFPLCGVNSRQSIANHCLNTCESSLALTAHAQCGAREAGVWVMRDCSYLSSS